MCPPAAARDDGSWSASTPDITTASIYFYGHVIHLDPMPFPSLADALYRAHYAAIYVATFQQVRRSVSRYPASAWLDGLVAGLGAGALLVTVALGQVMSWAGSGVAASLVALAYPTADLLLLLVSMAFAMLGWRPGFTWWVIAAGHLLFLSADVHGLMKPLTRAVLDQALAQCARWRADGLELSVAVNVSPSNLVDLALPAQVRELLDRHALPTSALVLEVTEGILMQERGKAMAVLSSLRSAGTKISIDD